MTAAAKQDFLPLTLRDITSFDPYGLIKNFRMLLIGRTGAGKSVKLKFAVQIVARPGGGVEKGMVMLGSDSEDYAWVPSAFVHKKGWDPAQIRRILKHQKKMAIEQKIDSKINKRMFLVLDDLSNIKGFKNSEELAGIHSKGRHSEITSFTIVHNWSEFPKSSRQNAEYIVVFGDSSASNLTAIYKEYAGIISYFDFKRLFNYATKHYGALVIHTNCQTGKVRDTFSIFRVPEESLEVNPNDPDKMWVPTQPICTPRFYAYSKEHFHDWAYETQFKAAQARIDAREEHKRKQERARRRDERVRRRAEQKRQEAMRSESSQLNTGDADIATSTIFSDDESSIITIASAFPPGSVYGNETYDDTHDANYDNVPSTPHAERIETFSDPTATLAPPTTTAAVAATGSNVDTESVERRRREFSRMYPTTGTPSMSILSASSLNCNRYDSTTRRVRGGMGGRNSGGTGGDPGRDGGGGKPWGELSACSF